MGILYSTIFSGSAMLQGQLNTESAQALSSCHQPFTPTSLIYISADRRNHVYARVKVDFSNTKTTNSCLTQQS